MLHKAPFRLAAKSSLNLAGIRFEPHPGWNQIWLNQSECTHQIWNLTWNQISNQIWNHLQRWFQIWFLKMWPSLNAAIWSTHPSHILNCPKRHLLHNPCATDVIIECENCMIYYISIFTAVEMASNIQWTLDKNFGWFPNRPTWEMYRMEHARQYKTYLPASQKVGSQSMSEQNK